MKKIIITILTLSTIALHSQSYKRTDLKVNDNTLNVDATNNRVGIGTSSPSEELTVNGSIYMTDDESVPWQGNNAAKLRFQYNTSAYIGTDVYNGGVSTTSAGWLASRGRGTAANREIVQDGDRALFLLSSFYSDKSSNDYDNSAGIVMYADGVDDTVADTAVGGKIVFETGEGGSRSKRLTIRANGTVGIGTTSPSYLLDVNGNVRADTYYYDVTSTLQSSSDSRLKQNITDMDNVLDKLKELELVKYEWNDNMYKKLEGRTSQSKLGGTFEGMIAQQVESLFPQYVGEDADGYKTLSYVSFVIPLLKGFQEQQTIIESQATEIEQLKTLITELSNRLTILENN